VSFFNTMQVRRVQAPRFFRTFLAPDPYAAPAIAKFSSFFPPLSGATNHLGLRLRPAHLSRIFRVCGIWVGLVHRA
jgi:hypothetical protein